MDSPAPGFRTARATKLGFGDGTLHVAPRIDALLTRCGCALERGGTVGPLVPQAERALELVTTQPAASGRPLRG